MAKAIFFILIILNLVTPLLFQINHKAIPVSSVFQQLHHIFGFGTCSETADMIFVKALDEPVVDAIPGDDVRNPGKLHGRLDELHSCSYLDAEVIFLTFRVPDGNCRWFFRRMGNDFALFVNMKHPFLFKIKFFRGITGMLHLHAQGIRKIGDGGTGGGNRMG